jgi:hypothetical protein
LQSHPRDSALHNAESEMDWPVEAGGGPPQPRARAFTPRRPTSSLPETR